MAMAHLPIDDVRFLGLAWLKVSVETRMAQSHFFYFDFYQSNTKLKS